MRWPLRRPRGEEERRKRGEGAQEKVRSPGKLLVREQGHKWITVGLDLGLGRLPGSETALWKCVGWGWIRYAGGAGARLGVGQNPF